MEVTTLGGGCFWCTEAVFSQLKGVEKIEPGYSGGERENPTYKEVSAGTTGHAEVAQITFDPNVISFKEILQIFALVVEIYSLGCGVHCESEEILQVLA